MSYLELGEKAALPEPKQGGVYALRPNDKNDQTPAGWDPAEAGRVLAALRGEIDRAGRDVFAGDPPQTFTRLAADLVAIGEGYARHPDREAERGWDSLELLRSLGPLVAPMAERIREQMAKPATGPAPCNPRGGR